MAVDAAVKDRIPPMPTREDFLLLKPSLKRSREDSDDRQSKRQKSSAHPDETVQPLDPDIRLEDIPRLCIHRPCPLVCVNQDIASVLSRAC